MKINSLHKIEKVAFGGDESGALLNLLRGRLKRKHLANRPYLVEDVKEIHGENGDGVEKFDFFFLLILNKKPNNDVRRNPLKPLPSKCKYGNVGEVLTQKVIRPREMTIQSRGMSKCFSRKPKEDAQGQCTVPCRIRDAKKACNEKGHNVVD